jgi:hypothetical protein
VSKTAFPTQRSPQGSTSHSGRFTPTAWRRPFSCSICSPQMGHGVSLAWRDQRIGAVISATFVGFVGHPCSVMSLPNPDSAPVMSADQFVGGGGVFTSVLRPGPESSPMCASRMPGTSTRRRRNATGRSVPRFHPCRARSEMIDPGRCEGTRDRSRILRSWDETVPFTGRGEVAGQVLIGCGRSRAGRIGRLTQESAATRFGRGILEAASDARRAHPADGVGTPPAGQCLDFILVGQREK